MPIAMFYPRINNGLQNSAQNRALKCIIKLKFKNLLNERL